MTVYPLEAFICSFIHSFGFPRQIFDEWMLMIPDQFQAGADSFPYYSTEHQEKANLNLITG